MMSSLVATGFIIVNRGIVVIRANPEDIARAGQQIKTSVNAGIAARANPEAAMSAIELTDLGKSAVEAATDSNTGLGTIKLIGSTAFGTGVGLFASAIFTPIVGAAIGFMAGKFYELLFDALRSHSENTTWDSDLPQEIQQAGEIGGTDYMESGLPGLIDEIQKAFAAAEKKFSPLIIDLDGDGIETISVNSGAYFDHDNNGFAEATSWVGPDDGLLVLDRNQDNKINSGRELFGNYTMLSGNVLASNGFAALSALDVNHDGNVNSGDADFQKIKIWKDVNGDAKVQNGELHSLGSYGISGLPTQYSNSDFIDANGNSHKQIGRYVKNDGSTGTMSDVWFNTNRAQTLDLGLVVESPADLSILNINGSGNVASLRQSILRDPSGILAQKLENFKNTKDTDLRRQIFSELQFKWAGVSSAIPNSRGNLIDARHLGVLEKFLGQDFRAPGEIPGPLAATDLKMAYAKLTDYQYSALVIKSDYPELGDILELKMEVSSSGELTPKVDVESAVNFLKSLSPTEISNAAPAIRTYIQSISKLGFFGESIINGFKSHCRLGGSELELTLFSLSYETKNGSLGLDSLGANTEASTYIDGQGGNDELTGSASNDILIGGKGIDTLSGGLGDDVYVYKLGDGADSIIERFGEGADRIILGPGILESETVLSRNGNQGRDLTMLFKDGGSIKIPEYFSSNYGSNVNGGRIDQIDFRSGTTWNYSSVVANLIQNGTASADNIVGLLDQANHINGMAGSDTISGNSANAILNGDAGDDNISGFAGNDLLSGGLGNDTLIGGTGDDVFTYSLGDGNDVLVEIVNEGFDTLRLGADIIAAETLLSRSGPQGRDLILTFKDGGSTKIQDFFSNYYASNVDGGRIEKIEFQNGTIWNYASVVENIVQNGTAGADNIVGLLAEVNKINGLGGSDTISGNSANDILNGDAGDDNISGFSGNDYLSGGLGNDALFGGIGDDVYFYNLGDGNDVITELINEGIDTLRLGSGILASETTVSRTGTQSRDLTLTFKDGGTEKIVNYFTNNYSTNTDGGKIEKFEFFDGSVWNYSQVNNLASSGQMLNNKSALSDLLVSSPSVAPLSASQSMPSRAFEINPHDGLENSRGEHGVWTYRGDYGNGLIADNAFAFTAAPKIQDDGRVGSVALLEAMAGFFVAGSATINLTAPNTLRITELASPT